MPDSPEDTGNRQQPELLPCVCCGRSFPPKDLAWHSEGLLCPDCLRERESCGCSD